MACPQYEEEAHGFDEDSEVPVSSDVLLRPQPGTRYIYKWVDRKDFDLWRMDGYRWQQNGKKPFTFRGHESFRLYFKLRVGPNKQYTTDFSKHAIICAGYPDRILIWYEGDVSVVVDFPHGNAKKQSKLSKPFFRTASSVLNEIKNKKDDNLHPVQIYGQLREKVPSGPPINQVILGPRDRKQVSNTLDRVREQARLDKCEVSSVMEMYHELDFVRGVTITPRLAISCFLPSKSLNLVL